jgi:outer membrane protein OmpA-like peptidoglycan-associated protein
MKIILLSFTLLFCSVYLFSQTDSIEENAIYSAEVYFDFGKDAIRTDADSILNEVVQFCKNAAPIFIKITAHTDDVGNNENNFKLSERRAEAVQKYLTEKEIQADSLTIAVFGENQPVASNNTDDGRQQNRRATIEVIQLRKMMPFNGKIIDKETGEGIEAEIVVRGKNYRDSTSSDELGQFESTAPLNEVIGIDVWAKGYFLETKMLKATPDAVADLDIALPQVKDGEKVDIENLYFVGNEAILLEKSEPELPKILKFMQINEGIKIEIAGHVNLPNNPPVSTTSWEYGLSVRRALLVYKYLLKNGIPEDRISYKGYGNWEMRFPKTFSWKEQQANRRVEIRVLEVN